MTAAEPKKGLAREIKFWLWSAVPEASWLHTPSEQELLLGTEGMALSAKRDPAEATKLASSISNTPATKALYPFIIALVAVSQGFLFGYSLGYTSPALTPLCKEMGLTNMQGSTFASLINIGAMVSGLLGGKALDMAGRKSSLVATSMLFVASFAVVAKATSYPNLLAGRLLMGVAAGLCTVAAPVYIAETAPKNLRGTLGTYFQLAITIGILAAYSVGAYTDWRDLAKWGAGLAVAFGIVGQMLLPESPQWLVGRGRKGDAAGVLQKLTNTEKEAKTEAEALIKSTEDDKKKGGGVSLAALSKGPLRRGVILASMLMIFQQLSGINAVIFFTGKILTEAGFGAVANRAAIIVALAQVVCTGISAALVDKLGRRPLLVFSGCGMAAGLAMLMSFFAIQASATGATSGILGLLAGAGPMLAASGLGIFISAFAFGWGPIPWLMVGELFPAEARGVASGLATVVNWGGSTIITQTFTIVLAALGPFKLFAAYAAFCALNVLWVLSPSFIETRGKSLSEIQTMLS